MALQEERFRYSIRYSWGLWEIILTSAGSSTVTLSFPRREDSLAAMAQPPHPPPTTRTLQLRRIKSYGNINIYFHNSSTSDIIIFENTTQVLLGTLETQLYSDYKLQPAEIEIWSKGPLDMWQDPHYSINLICELRENTSCNLKIFKKSAFKFWRCLDKNWKCKLTAAACRGWSKECIEMLLAEYWTILKEKWWNKHLWHLEDMLYIYMLYMDIDK